MALVDYSSSEPDDESDAGPRPAQSCRDEPRRSPTETTRSTSAAASSPQALESTSEHQPFASALPPLPPSFHDLYASTVRTATADLPSLHEGRRRIIPHKDGNWPSHIYLEWHPTSSQHQLLQSLLAALARDLHCLLIGHGLAGFLTSDLGAPLPLHVSLSRPFVLRTDEKDAFFELLVREIARCRVPTFTLACDDLSWHRSPESARSFLVLRVRGPRGANDELSALLRACNHLVASYGQPELYAPTGSSDDNSSHVGDAFHVSLAWSFAEPTAEMRQTTAEVFARPGFRNAILSRISIPVEGVKVKIGNVVKNIALPETGGRGGSAGVKGLFGI
ncbi:poly(U)-specific 3'-to-5' RNA exonuclease [Diaporthe australafricana]|uniref:U6 snRNA phosphodiesterase n=1 Tax=Diaporthe australafricana TaxID=127596 RepID=A0ABR3Y2U6_9PEZI